MKQKVFLLIPLCIGLLLSTILGIKTWVGFWFVFLPIGASISLGMWIASLDAVKDKDLGRRIGITGAALVFLVFLGLMQRENLQLEETVFYLAYFISTGLFTRVLVHYAIAKVFGPFIWGRGYCGWACWTAAVLEWLPIPENRPIPKSLTWLRVPVLLVSLLIPFLLIAGGYDYLTLHIQTSPVPAENFPLQARKLSQLIWFLVGNGIYYVVGIALAFGFRKKRAFCKIACPVSLIMKAQTRVSLIKIAPSGKACVGCGQCNRACPMDVDVMGYIRQGRRVLSSECILCGVCKRACPVGAIR